VGLAQAILHDPPVLILDEPTDHLDLPSRIQLMRLLLRLARQTNKGILISTHELDLALQVADEVWLLSAGGQLHKGTAEDLVLNGNFEAAFNKEGILFDKASGSFPMNQGNGKYIMLEGEGVSAFWTKRALIRLGFTVNVHQQTPHTIRIVEERGQPSWILEYEGQSQKHETIASLLHALNKETY
jgi:iron complex transport system ATP-binding protein